MFMHVYVCVCVGVCVRYVRSLQMCVFVCIRERVFTQQKQLCCQQRKEQSILELLLSLCSIAACGISAESCACRDLNSAQLVISL